MCLVYTYRIHSVHLHAGSDVTDGHEEESMGFRLFYFYFKKRRLHSFLYLLPGMVGLTLSIYRKENNIHNNMAKLNQIVNLRSRVIVALDETRRCLEKDKIILCFDNSLRLCKNICIQYFEMLTCIYIL